VGSKSKSKSKSRSKRKSTGRGAKGAGGVGQAVQEKEYAKPGWGIPLFLFGIVTLLIGWTEGPWNWWALLWIPLYVAGVGTAALEWGLLARARWAMSFVGWAALVTAHIGALLTLGLATGVLSR
jgi:hypothetical protein